MEGCALCRDGSETVKGRKRFAPKSFSAFGRVPLGAKYGEPAS